MKQVMLALALFLGFGAMAQQKVQWGIRAGYNAARSYSNDPEIKEDGGILSGYHFGVQAEMKLSKSISLQPQLNYNRKGVSVAHDGHADRFHFNVIDLPVNFVYRSKGGFFAGAGPNFGYNLSGGLKSTEDPTENFDFEFGSKVNEIKRFDLGANFLLGYQFKKNVFISANYLAGMTNLSNAPGNTWRNNLFGFSVGYVFGK